MSSDFQFTNKLINETSPYLLQHAHNPVNWFPWCNEALELAKQSNKPILISIGYSACHWCHVMEKESFENIQTANLMNQFFINIKIDREERPDLDHIYMDAVQAISGSGGWPLNVFLTPDLKPFYGGTYFPPIPAYNRKSWNDVLVTIHQAYTNRKDEIDQQANQLTDYLIQSNQFGSEDDNSQNTTSTWSKEDLDSIANNLLAQADTTWGGFGNSPKFPQTLSIQFLLRHYHASKNEKSLQHAILSLEKMIQGGIYDQLGGGFARYSTDIQWKAPHFEKMLYDNALLISVLSEAYQITKSQLFAKTIKQTIQFINREMTSPEGGFYSALDADSEGVEGKYYTWSKNEIETLLGEDANNYCEYYQITPQGNWEETNILWTTTTSADFAHLKGMTEQDWISKLDYSNNILLQQRQSRTYPQLDDKIILGWNALMVTAYCKAYLALQEDSYKLSAIDNLTFLENKFQKEGEWKHTYKNGEAKISAFLDDYAYLIQAYINMMEIQPSNDYLDKAFQLTEYVIENFLDHQKGLFYYTPINQTDLIIRKKETYDGATPSGNAVMALCLYKLSFIAQKPEWNNLAIKNVISLKTPIAKYPSSFGCWASIIQTIVEGLIEITIYAKNLQYIPKEVLFHYLPNRVIQILITNDSETNEFLKEGKDFAIIVCKNNVCSSPIYQISDFYNSVTNETLICTC